MLGPGPVHELHSESDIEDYSLHDHRPVRWHRSVDPRKDDKVYISEPYEGFPSAKAGIWAGDEIPKVDGPRGAGHGHPMKSNC